MKIVINNCYGGFSLSPKGVKRLSELQGRECYFYEFDFKNDVKKFIRNDEILNKKDILFFSTFTIGDQDKLNKIINDKDWHTMTDKQKKKYNEQYEKISFNNGRDIDRTDKLLIQVVEELGEDADGSCAKLKIVEIPDGTDYCIEEYDGNEWIAEKHQTWQ